MIEVSVVQHSSVTEHVLGALISHKVGQLPAAVHAVCPPPPPSWLWDCLF